MGNSSIVKLLLSIDDIDVSATFQEKSAVFYATANRRVASWSTLALDGKINEQGRLECQILFQNEEKKEKI